MNKIKAKSLLTIFVLFALLALTQSCSDTGGNEDKTSPTVSSTTTTLSSNGEVIGKVLIQWSTDEANPSLVDIYLSTDLGATFPTAIVLNAPDTGSYEWDSNEVADCRACRIRIIARDSVGNASEPADSANDFIINNVPQVLGSAFYTDTNNDGLGDGDFLRVPFDKELVLKTSIASDIFFFPVQGDGVGAFAEIALSSDFSEIIISINALGSAGRHLHIGDSFNNTGLSLTASSGINLQDNIAAGILVARDTGRTAAVVELGIDIKPTLNDSGQTFYSDGTESVALGDVDGDGDLDLVVGINFFSGNRIYLNGGDNSGSNTGIFTDSGQSLFGGFFANSTKVVVIGDVDGDGDQDIVAGNGAGSDEVWLNGGDNSGSNTGVFASGSFFGGGSDSMALGDVDGDGDLDVVTGDTGSPNRVWLNGGDNSGSNTGVFTNSGQSLGNSATESVAFGDIDGDGDLDIVSGNSGASGEANRVWINGGDNTGVFTDSGQTLGNNQTQSVTLGDIDGDGDLDFVTGNGGASGEANRVWINGGDSSGSNTGVFIDSGQLLGSVNTTAVLLADMDGDDDLDLVTVSPDAPYRVWLNRGSNTGVFIDSGQVLQGGQATLRVSMVAGDVDGDGDLDLLVGESGDPGQLWLNSLRHPSDDLFIDSGQILGSNITTSVALADVDGDGDQDIVTGNDGELNRVWLNGGDNSGSSTGLYTDSGQMLGSNNTKALVLGDVDGDGDQDIIVGNSGEPNRVWLNGGDNSGSNTGIFTDVGPGPGSSAQALVLGDIDDDGDLDLIEGRFNDTLVWLNGGDNSGSNTGVFVDSGQSLGTNNAQSLVLGDIDDDGDLDLVAGKSNGNEVWLNSGSYTGVFTNTGQVLGDSSSNAAVVLDDMDGDGDLDVVCKGNFGFVRVWLNGGDNSGSNTGVFVNSGQAIFVGDNFTLLSGDVDGDGDLDIVAGNSGFGAGPPNRVLLNNGSNSGVFSVAGQLIGSGFSQSVALGDVDNDGDLDMVTGNVGALNGGEGNLIWLNDY